MYKAIKVTDNLIDKCISLISIIILLIGMWFIYDSIYVFSHAEANVSAFRPKKGGSTDILKDLSEDAIAWIYIDGTSIDYPIMQGEDNVEYLNKDPYGEYSLAGSIFLDSRNSSDFSDYYSLVYGHHMAGGHMFGALDEFKNKEYLNKHKTGYLMVDNKTYDIEVFAFLETDANEDIIFNPTSGGDVLGFIQRNADIYYKPVGNRIIALSTCKSPMSTLRFIVFASIIGD